MSDIGIGDVVMDLTEGRPLHVVGVSEHNAAVWSEQNGYDLLSNYGNERLDASPEDAVYKCVYCNTLKHQPSKVYSVPASRLGRVETEAADDGEPVADRVRADLLADLFAEAHHIGNGELTAALEAIATAVADDETVARARRGE
jgi:hypothetical protein